MTSAEYALFESNARLRRQVIKLVNYLCYFVDNHPTDGKSVEAKRYILIDTNLHEFIEKGGDAK